MSRPRCSTDGMCWSHSYSVSRILQFVHNPPDVSSNTRADGATYKEPNRRPDRTTDVYSYSVPYRESDGITNDVPDGVSDCIPNRVTDCVPNHYTDAVSNRVTNKESDHFTNTVTNTVTYRCADSSSHWIPDSVVPLSAT